MNQQTFTITVTTQNAQIDILAEFEKMRKVIEAQNNKIEKLENEIYWMKKRQGKDEEPKQKPKEEKPMKCLFKKPEQKQEVTKKQDPDIPKKSLFAKPLKKEEPKMKVKKTDSSNVDDKCQRLKLLLG